MQKIIRTWPAERNSVCSVAVTIVGSGTRWPREHDNISSHHDNWRNRDDYTD